MPLDYSKLSNKELEAIANNDYSKLSTKTLQAISEEPEAVATQPQKSRLDHLKDIGKSFASLADTGINAATGMLDYGAYNLARAAGRSPEQAQQETTSNKDIIGHALGIQNDPAYQQELSRQMMQGIGNFANQNVVQPVSQATGISPQDVNSYVQSLGLAASPLVGKAGQVAGQAAFAAEPYIKGAPAAIAKAPINFGKGFYEGVTNPAYREGSSAMIPLREQYTPVPAAQRFMGQMPGVEPQSLEQLQSQARPTSELLNNPIDKFAQATAPVNPEGYPLVPMQGRGMEAWGERVGRGIRTNPGQAMLEAGVTALTGIPVKTISQGVSELAARHLANKTQFSPEFPQAVQQAQGQAGLQSQMPTQPLLENNPTSTGPVEPQPLYASTTGNVGSTPESVQQADLAQKYPTQSPAKFAQEAAASKIQGLGPVEPEPMAEPQAPAQQLPNERWTDADRLRVQQEMNKPKVEAAPMAEEAPMEPTTPTSYKDSLLKKYGSEQAVNEKATDVERALISHELNKTNFASVSVSGGHAKKVKNIMNEAEASGKPVKVAVTGKNGGYDVVYNKGTFAGDPSIVMKKTTVRKNGEIDFIGEMADGTKITGETRGANTIIKDSNGNVVAEYVGAKKKAPDVSQMLTEDKVFNTKAEWDKENMFNTLAGNKRVGGYKEGEHVVREEEPDYSSIPESLRKELPKRSMVKRDSKGKRVE